MTTYVDSSVLLRVVLGERGRLAEWSELDHGVTSALTEVESLRTLDRLRIRSMLGDTDLAERRATVFRILERLDIVELTQIVLARASQPFPSALGTLDAMHLATALIWQESFSTSVTMATHDEALGLAAKACGMAVIGL